MADIVDNVKAAISDRAELPGMSLMEHLGELRKRLIHATVYLLIGFVVAYTFHERLYGFVQAPLDKLGIALNFTHPTDGLNLYLKTSLVGGAILASPFILYQIWLFISPGMYANEKRYVVPFMFATVSLFLAGGWFGYHYVLPGAIKVLVLQFGHRFHPILTIEDYTGFFMAVILGLGITFELPILIFFLALFGIVDAKFLRQAHPLRDPDHLRHRGGDLPHARSDRHVPVCHPYARSLLCGCGGCLPCSPSSTQSQRVEESCMKTFPSRMTDTSSNTKTSRGLLLLVLTLTALASTSLAQKQRPRTSADKRPIT